MAAATTVDDRRVSTRVNKLGLGEVVESVFCVATSTDAKGRWCGSSTGAMPWQWAVEWRDLYTREAGPRRMQSGTGI